MDIMTSLLGELPIPKFIKVRQVFPRYKLENIEEEIKNQLRNKQLLNSIEKGQKIAITAGSRGIANIALIIKEVVKNIKEVGGEAFVIPAMGSHGGASAKGQINILKEMGITEEYIDAPIKATMEVVKIGDTNDGLPVYIDKYADEADGIVVINRIKPHVGFRGKYESGLMKMITIGLGKQMGASISHDLGFRKMAENVYAIACKVIEKKNIIFALGILENSYDETCKIVIMGKGEISTQEPPLLDEAKNNLATICLAKFDILIVDEIGKDITGTGMDTNVIGRYHTPYASGGPEITKIVVLDLTEKSHGNGNGIGLADFTTRRFFNKMKLDQTYPNSITSTVQETIKIPMIMNSDKLAIQAAIKTCNILNKTKVKLVRIKNTLELKYIYISESLLEEVKRMENAEIIGQAEEFKFDEAGNLF